jgi:hypothetical protein
LLIERVVSLETHAPYHIVTTMVTILHDVLRLACAG